MKNLLIISTNFPPSKSIGTKRILKICKFLDKTKWRISILTLNKKYYDTSTNSPEESQINTLDVYRTAKLDVITPLLNLKQNILKNEHKNKSNIKNQKLETKPKKNSNGSVVKKIWKFVKDFFTDIFQFPDKHVGWLPFAFFKALRIIRKNKIDVIYSSSPPHSVHIISTLLKIITRKKLIIEFRDPWSRSPWHIERDSNTYERLKHYFLKKLESFVVTYTDYVILITQEMKINFTSYYKHIPPEKFVVLYNGYDPDIKNEFAQRKKADVSDSNNLPIVFTHTGTLYKLRDPSPILLAIKNMYEQNLLSKKNCLFQFIGVITDDLIHVKKLTHDLGIHEFVKFLPPIPSQEVYKILLNSNILMLIQPVTKLQLPGKFYDYICFNKPIFAVGETGGSTENMIKNRFGLFADYNDKNEIQNSIKTLIEDPDYQSSQSEKYSLEYNMLNIIKEFESILEL